MSNSIYRPDIVATQDEADLLTAAAVLCASPAATELGQDAHRELLASLSGITGRKPAEPQDLGTSLIRSRDYLHAKPTAITFASGVVGNWPTKNLSVAEKMGPILAAMAKAKAIDAATVV